MALALLIKWCFENPWVYGTGVVGVIVGYIAYTRFHGNKPGGDGLLVAMIAFVWPGIAALLLLFGPFALLGALINWAAEKKT